MQKKVLKNIFNREIQYICKVEIVSYGGDKNMNIRNAQLEDINKISVLMLQIVKIHSNARKDIFKEKILKK